MVTYNRLDLTKITFEKALKNVGDDYNLIIIDNNSEDETVNWLNNNLLKLNIPYTLIKLNKNMGIAYGRNLGLKIYDEYYDKSDYLATLDNDVVLPDNWLKRCCDVLTYNKIISACGVNLEDAEYSKTKVKINDSGYENIQIKTVGNLGTACSVFSADVHTKLGFFDNFETYGHEDALMFNRLKFADRRRVIAYLEEKGNHLGVGDKDAGEYRELKNKFWDINMKIFNKKIREYANGIIPLYQKFENYDKSLEENIYLGK